MDSKWIPVAERLPEQKEYIYEDDIEPSGFGKSRKSDYVLVYTNRGNITIGMVEQDKFDIEVFVMDTATHWMPLPEAPKEKEN